MGEWGAPDTLECSCMEIHTKRTSMERRAMMELKDDLRRTEAVKKKEAKLEENETPYATSPVFIPKIPYLLEIRTRAKRCPLSPGRTASTVRTSAQWEVDLLRAVFLALKSPWNCASHAA